MKSPSIAVFSDPNKKNEEIVVLDDDSNTYKIFGYVDSENGFGASIRSYFTVKIKIDENYSEDNSGYGCNVEDVKIE